MEADGSRESDAEVIARSRLEPSAFAAIFDRHFVTIHRYLARRLGGASADDLAGEVFRVAFERRETFDARADRARPWLYGIATNLLRNHRRSEQRRLRAFERLVVEAGVDTLADDFVRSVARVDAEASRRQISLAIEELAPRDRDALILFAVEGLTYREVGLALGIPIGTVRSRINRAGTQLRELLAPDGQQRRDSPEVEACDG
jgi:RNA polymerase sigma-70 factor (ECF subfamily)